MATKKNDAVAPVVKLADAMGKTDAAAKKKADSAANKKADSDAKKKADAESKKGLTENELHALGNHKNLV